MSRFVYGVPVGALAIIAFLFFHGPTASPPGQLQSLLVDRPAPQTILPPLDKTTIGFGPMDMKAGHVTVLNIWASWCMPCRAEVPALKALAQLQGVSLYGMVYEDAARDARRFLLENGNPFSRIDIDTGGRAGIAWGVAGVPETFVIDGKGIVRLRYAGPVVGSVLDEVIRPAIERARTAG